MTLLVVSIATMPIHGAGLVIIDQPLPNGDFNNDLVDWTIEVSPDPATPPGTVQVVGGAARIVKGGAYLAGLSQSFVAPEGLMALRLRLAELPQFASDGGFIPEAFDVHLVGASGFSRAATFRADASAAANVSAVPGVFNLGSGVTLNGATLRIPLDGIVAGEPLTLSVTLAGASTYTTTSVAIDDVVLEVRMQQPPDPSGPDRANDCELFRDSLEDERGVGRIPSCALGQIGDTGITTCAGDLSGNCPVAGMPGQDAEFGRDFLAQGGMLERLGGGPAGFDYTKLDAAGNILPQSATEWSCVLDNHAGLVWEVKVDDAASPSHFGHSYTWFQPDGAVNGGMSGLANGGICIGSDCDTAGLASAMNDGQLCGATGWRMPTRKELLGLVHAGRVNPALATEFFPNGGGEYWSSTPAASDSSSAWQINFNDGQVSKSQKTSPLKVRLVREVQQ